jgi:hypothetical protein
MIKFIYNEQGVCENPILKTLKCTKHYEAQISVAIVKNGKWSYAIRFYGQDQGWGQPLIYHAEHNVFDTQEEAYRAGALLLYNQIKSNNDYKRYDRILDILLSEIRTKTEKQLTLF